MLTIDVRQSDELRSVVIALRAVDQTIAKNIRKYTQSDLAPAWAEAVRGRSHTGLEVRALGNTARTSVSSGGITLKAATVGRRLTRGFDPKLMYAGVEFGGDRQKRVTYQARSKKGKTYNVTRRTQAMLPARRRSGPVYGAAAEMIPRAAALWTQTTVRTIAEAAEGKEG
ncbi:hypothetical protein [Curtobacterium sp. MCBA15_008]|uniref:hypothetical protein n=1 Tax=Curtobacterium sp. MCBA15_008 TaxID=1898736 RepID=UPI0008DD5A2D|nr:hypothetical protein [Curtobacterium sp. MCBA15_008]OII04314.1 hypothetical protein BIU96_07900 [Curtobacterium sp. MCBA15_008]